MKNILLVLSIFLLCLSCKPGMKVYDTAFQGAETETILSKKMSVRAILIDNDKLWYAADSSRLGYCNFKTGEKVEKKLSADRPTLEFRSIAQTPAYIFVASIGSPAYIYKISKTDLSYQKVYSETNEKVFYDSMNFWNEKEGIVVGDPIEDCLSILITRDGGNTWQKSSCEELPKTTEGETVFAASNTNICIKGNNTWIVTGGKKARVFYSPNKGKKWKVFETPIVEGEAITENDIAAGEDGAMMGIFSADFYDKKTGFIVGGNYRVKGQTRKNKALTLDGGKTWLAKADGKFFGYASCVQFMPNPNWLQLVSVGPSGIYYSVYDGDVWHRMDNYFSPELDLYTIRFLDDHTAFAAGKDKIVKIHFLK